MSPDSLPHLSARFFLLMNDFKKGETIYFDDVEIYRIPSATTAISNVAAAQEALTVSFHAEPNSEPVASDFTIERSINAGSWEAVSSAELVWEQNAKMATLSVSHLPQQPWDQNILYRVSYRMEPAVKSNWLDIPGAIAGLTQRVNNASFETWNSEIEAEDWAFHGEGFERSTAVTRTGTYSLVADGLQPGQNEVGGGGGPFQSLDLEPGHYAGVFRFNTAVHTDGVLSWTVQSKVDGQLFRTMVSNKRSAAMSEGAWVPFEFEFEIMPGEYGARFFIFMNDFSKGDTIYFDDVEIYRIEN